MNDPVKYSKALSRATNAAIPFLRPSKVDGDEDRAVESAIEWLYQSVEAAERGLVAISEMGEGRALGVRPGAQINWLGAPTSAGSVGPAQSP